VKGWLRRVVDTIGWDYVLVLAACVLVLGLAIVLRTGQGPR
jgi:hypothetical protein